MLVQKNNKTGSIKSPLLPSLFCFSILCLSALTLNYFNKKSKNNFNENISSRKSSNKSELMKEATLENYEFDSENRIKQEFLKLRSPQTNVIPAHIKQKENEFYRTTFAKNFLLKQSSIQDNWSSIGPNGLGGRTRALGLDVRNENIINAGAATSGMFQSTDNGKSWVRTSTADDLPSVTCLIQDTRPGEENNWYYATGEYRSPSLRFGNVLYSGDGIFKSTNNGKSWSVIPATSTGKPNLNNNSFDFIYNLALDNSNKNQTELYAATFKGIRRSTDGGATWQQVLGDNSTPDCYSDVIVTPSGIVYATISSSSGIGGVYKSFDGINWAKFQPSDFPEQTKRFVIAYAPSNESIIYLFGQTENFGAKIDGFYGFPEWYAVWRYHPQADNWLNLSNNIPTQGYQNFNSLNSYCMYLKVAPTNPELVFIGLSNLYSTLSGFLDSELRWLGGYSDNGAWNLPKALHPDQHSFAFSNTNPNVIYCGNDGGIKKTNIVNNSDFSNSWEQLNNGYVTSQFYSASIDKSSQTNYVAGGAQDNGSWLAYTANLNTEWESIGGGDGCMTEVLDKENIYYATQNGWIYKIDNDNGVSYLNKGGDANYLFVNPFILPNTDEIYTAAGSYIKYLSGLDSKSYYDYNEQAPWQIMENTRLENSEIQISALATSGDRLLYGTTNGKLFLLNNRQNLTEPTTDITSAEFPKNAYINCIATSDENKEFAVVVFTNYNVRSVFFTDDMGKTWNDISGNLEENPDGSGNGPSCKWASLLHLGSERYKIYLGTSIGLYSVVFGKNGFSAWEQEGKNSIGNCIVDMIDFNANKVVAASWGRGIFAEDRPTFSVNENDKNKTENGQSSLLVCNEVQDVLKLKLVDYRQQNIDYKIFDVNGKLVLNGSANSPEIKVSSLPAGNYFISINGNFQRFIKY